MINYFTLPGYGNSGEEHWQSFFEKQLPNCTRINQKNWLQPDMHDWLETIEACVNAKINRDIQISKSIIFITHSLGGIALAHWAKKYHNTAKNHIKAALIVAPPDLENPAEPYPLESFKPMVFDKLPFKSVVVASSNDDWASLERSKYFAKCWGSEFINIGAAGHINTSAGFGAWPEGLDILRELE